MYWQKEIDKPKCVVCGRSAKVEVFNDKNSSLGYYCRTCAALLRSKSR